MSKKTRLAIVLICVACFLGFAPVLVAYSMGYRFDFEKIKIVATGGIYIRSFPAAEQISVNSNAPEKPSMFGNSIFVQSLLPRYHTVSIKKTGYYDYFKTLPVKENQVTKLENVLLIKKNIEFSELANNVDYFSIAPNNQNAIIVKAQAKGFSFDYFIINNIAQAKTFSINQAGYINSIKWSSDSNRALIEIKNSAGSFYYLVDTELQKLSGIRLSYLDSESKDISFNPQDSLSIFYISDGILYLAKGNSALPVIHNVASFKILGEEIIWLSPKGTLSASNLLGQTTKILATWNINEDYINPANHSVDIISDKIFVTSKDSLFKYNAEDKSLEYLFPILNDYKLLQSPDSKNIISYNSSEIYLYNFEFSENNKAGEKSAKLFSSASGEKITSCFWLNNDYIIFQSGNRVLISETDIRGEINIAPLPQQIALQDAKNLSVENPQIFFNPQDNKLYLLTQNTFVLSERLVP